MSDSNSYNTGWSRNFPTPAHLFEEHTKIQMEGFLEMLESDIKNKKIDITSPEYEKYVKRVK